MIFFQVGIEYEIKVKTLSHKLSDFTYTVLILLSIKKLID